MLIGPLPPLRQKSKDCPRPHLILCPQIEGTVIVKKSDHCSCSRDLGSTATSGSPLWRVGDGRVPCGGRYHAKFQSPPYLEIRVDLFKLLFNSWPCFAIVFNLFFFFKAYPNTINYWMKHQKEMLLNGWVIAMQISCICNVYESCESWLGPALYRIGKDSLTRRLRNQSFAKIGLTPHHQFWRAA